MKKIIKRLFSSLGYELKRKKAVTTQQQNHQMVEGLRRANSIGIVANTIVDVGAAAGAWSLRAAKVWPQSSFVMFEPLHERKVELEALCRKHSQFQFINAAAGKERTQIKFIISDDLDGSGVASLQTPDALTRKVDVLRIDTEIRDRGLKGPYIIKLDTHGFEVPIIEGCSGILNEIVLFVIECYGFQIADNSLVLWEMCQHMDRLGFRLVDIVDLMNRPKDGAFWQCDAFFVRKDNALFAYNHYT